MQKRGSILSDEILPFEQVQDISSADIFRSPFANGNPPLEKSISPGRSEHYLPPALVSPEQPVPRTISRIINPLQMFRHLFSKNRRRTVHAKYDLDLTYITDRIIGMSIPGYTTFLSVVCNPYSQVKNFLDSYHPNSYKVYNLCIEYEYKGEELFDGRYRYFPTEDMQPPSLQDMYKFCIDAHQWLNQDSNNIVVIHCKGGKGRTGCMICALLVYLAVIQKEEYSEFLDPDQALYHFATLRTVDMQGITRASQKNYVRRFGEIVNLLKLGMFETVHPIRMLKLVIHGLDEDLQRSGRLLVKVYFRTHDKANSEKVARAQITSRFSGEKKQEYIFENRNYRAWYEEQCIVLDFAPIFESMEDQWVIAGDIKISVRMFRPRAKTLFYTWFSTLVLQASGVACACYDSLDKPYKYMLALKENIKIELQYQKLEEITQENYNIQQKNCFQQQNFDSNEIQTQYVDSSISTQTIMGQEISRQLNQQDTQNLSNALEQTINKIYLQQQQFNEYINKYKNSQSFTQNIACDEDEFEEEEEDEEEEEICSSTQNDLLRFDDDQFDFDNSFLQQNILLY
eukprot:TRINITY_DN7143_c0_g1_i6.p1 TRINITY_DN7143_c0_g1~~TRINITY_DN7143_c0_g1_i6.p1  ORF type:complete len:570 (-),score=73.78 TRINITY_DN7143_c0_g1_i6:246-1955(-)